uniref:histidine--tRNA ligase n=1 Tax=Rhizophora mucronata TaxID=61149 RepID=A0A2P2KQK6_RHIMU
MPPLHIPYARISGYLKPLVVFHYNFPLSCFSKRCIPTKPRALSSSVSAQAPSEGGGVRSGALSASPVLEESVQRIDVNPPKGTRDFPPEEMRLRNWLFNNFREVSRLYGFEEVDFPVLESEALFIRKAGEEIRDQLYCFEDRGNRRVALRPELTPSLARLVIQKGKSVSLPLKWFAVGQCWRYERMTRGRRREHYQWNMDIIGVPEVTAEAELISSIVTFFKQIGVTSSDVGFKVSSRKVLQEVLRFYSISENMFGKVCVIIDKIEKIPMVEIKKELNSLGMSEEAIEELLQVLSVKSLTKLEGCRVYG